MRKKLFYSHRNLIIFSIIFCQFVTAQFPNDTLESAFGLLPIDSTDNVEAIDILDSLPVINQQHEIIASELSDLQDKDDKSMNKINSHPGYDLFLPDTTIENSETTVNKNEIELSRRILNNGQMEKSEKYVNYGE